MSESFRFLIAVALFMPSFRELALNNSNDTQPEYKPLKVFVPTTTTGNHPNPFGANWRAIPTPFQSDWRPDYAV